MKHVKNFEEALNEGLLPDWALPGGEVGQLHKWLEPNYTKYIDRRQSMARFTVGDKIIESRTGFTGVITSMGDGMNQITWKCPLGITHFSYPQDLEKIM
jgi:hypothetical protein